MARPDIAWLATTALDAVTNLLRIRAFIPLSDDPDDKEEFSEIPSLQALGVTAMPYPPTDHGHAEGVVLRDCGNRDGVLVGGRDARSAHVTAEMKPGDTVLHATDPDAKAQVRCHANRQLALVTEDADGNTMVQLLDGKNNKVQVAAFGGMIEMSKDGGVAITAPGGKCSIVMKGDTIALVGKVVLGGTKPAAGGAVVYSPASAYPVVGPAASGLNAPNVFIGM